MINSAIASSSASAPVSAAATVKNAAAESQDRFLKLLVTQMRNQDPLNPLDNAQVTSQMAQLSTVSGIDKLNSTLEALSSSMIAAQSMQAASMIGHVVMVPGNGIDLANSKGMAAVDLAQPADSVSVAISDASGNVVRHLQLGSQSSGSVPFQWDGLNDAGQPLADGSYTFSASSQLGGVKSDAGALAYGVVNSVMQGPQGATLYVAGLGEISLTAVKQIL